MGGWGCAYERRALQRDPTWQARGTRRVDGKRFSEGSLTGSSLTPNEKAKCLHWGWEMQSDTLKGKVKVGRLPQASQTQTQTNSNHGDAGLYRCLSRFFFCCV